ncbi:MAG: fumarylacetoacetate hydrolase family protein [Salibacteraceae bacterium]
MDVKAYAKKLDQAAAEAHPIEQLSLKEHFDLEVAYDLQREAILERMLRGNEIIGLKMGFTSVAKMEQMGVHDLIWGRLTSDMLISNGGSVNLASFIHPRAEPEICFRIAKDIHGEIALEDLDEYVDAIAPAIEIIDSRFENFKFSLEDVIADNCSSAGVVIGEWHKPSRSIDGLQMKQYFNDEVVAEGSSEAILGDPWKSLQAATRLAAKYKEPIKTGHIVLAGAATAAIFLKPSTDVRVEVESLGEVSFTVKA